VIAFCRARADLPTPVLDKILNGIFVVKSRKPVDIWSRVETAQVDGKFQLIDDRPALHKVCQLSIVGLAAYAR
jgi:hypothetical protein